MKQIKLEQETRRLLSEELSHADHRVISSVLYDCDYLDEVRRRIQNALLSLKDIEHKLNREEEGPEPE